MKRIGEQKLERISDDLFTPLTAEQMRNAVSGSDPSVSSHVCGQDVDSHVDAASISDN